MEKINDKDLQKIVEIDDEEAKKISGGLDLERFEKCKARCEEEDRKRHDHCMEEPVGEFNKCLDDSFRKLQECRKRCFD